MLAALGTGVKGDRWFSLVDKVYSPANLWSAWAKVARNKGAPGVDGLTVDRCADGVEANLAHLSEQLKAGTPQPKPIRRTHIPRSNGTTRPLGIPTVRDRIVQRAISTPLKVVAADTRGTRAS